ncbi:hypothetical protein KTO58_01240 [Chitinophaga pendula]|uniref:hypothetical protein n=1 Tax=Chitinophaga TaxID=79328 RepID=UPI000BB06372|nr:MULTISPECIES: hypothetical protein [Chitinophaga]ASZ14513.1 hypothetical protein CK934_27980 [Chitinophaga sp. MD30]UCJ07830.1 hypothetical protein KTO58_01240 [Chitinophaga pendula]
MAEKVEIGIEVNPGDSGRTVANIKKEIKEATAEAIRLSREFGELSPSAQDAAKRLAGLKDEMADLSERVALFDPGKKFAVFGNVVNSVAGGFTAAQGAMAVFGSESEDLQKQLVKLQGAIALTQGLSTIADSWKDFQRLGLVVRTYVVTAFTTLRGALIATGIGALIVVVGTLIANLESVEKWLKKIIPGFEGFATILNKLKAVGSGLANALIEPFKVLGDVISNLFKGDFSGAITAAKGLGERLGDAFNKGFNDALQSQRQAAAAEALKALNERLERELKVRKAYGQNVASQEEEIARNAAAAKLLEFGADSKEYLDAQADFNATIASNRKAAADKAAADAKSAADKNREYAMLALKDLQNLQALEYKQAQLRGDNLYKLKQQQLEAERQLLISYGQSTKDIQQQIDLEMLAQREQLTSVLKDKAYATTGNVSSLLQNVGKALVDLEQRNIEAQTAARIRTEEEEEAKRQAFQRTNDYLSFIVDNRAEMGNTEAAIAAAAAAVVAFQENAKQDAFTQTANVLKAASGVLGAQSKVGKAVAIASATIEAISGAAKSFTALAGIPIIGPGLGAAAAAAALVAGYARVRQIAKVQVLGGGGDSPGSPPNVSMSAPLQPSIPTNNSTIVDRLDDVNSNLRESRRVYVLEKDITDTQDRVAKIEQNAKF